MKIVSELAIAILIWSVFGCSAAASTIDIQETVIDKESAIELGISVEVFEEGSGNFRFQDVYIAIPAVYRNSSLRGVMLQVKQNGELLLEASLRVMTLKNYRGFSRFHGVSIRMYDQNVESSELKVTYGRGTTATERLVVPVMELMEDD